MSDLKDVFNEWMNNPLFKEKFKQDPIQACHEAKLDVSPENLEKIKAMLNLLEKFDNEELDKRISK